MMDFDWYVYCKFKMSVGGLLILLLMLNPNLAKIQSRWVGGWVGVGVRVLGSVYPTFDAEPKST